MVTARIRARRFAAPDGKWEARRFLPKPVRLRDLDGATARTFKAQAQFRVSCSDRVQRR
jgi:hypothetical protein